MWITRILASFLPGRGKKEAAKPNKPARQELAKKAEKDTKPEVLSKNDRLANELTTNLDTLFRGLSAHVVSAEGNGKWGLDVVMLGQVERLRKGEITWDDFANVKDSGFRKKAQECLVKITCGLIKIKKGDLAQVKTVLQNILGGEHGFGPPLSKINIDTLIENANKKSEQPE